MNALDMSNSRAWLRDLGPTLVALAVFWLTWSYNRWQVRFAKQKLRQDLYDRRFAIYVAFQELLLALPEKGDDEIRAAFRKASVARLQAPFLLGDTEIQVYLERLCKRVHEDVIANIMYCDAIRRDPALRTIPEVVAELTTRASHLGKAKLDLPDQHLKELPQRFAAFLTLQDFLR